MALAPVERRGDRGGGADRVRERARRRWGLGGRRRVVRHRVRGGGGSGRSVPLRGGPPGPSGRLEVSDLGINAGAPDAPIQVVEFSDFGCPHCRAFHEEVYPVLHEEYVETGRVIWKYVPFVLGLFPNSVEAARAGECGIEQDGFEPLRARLFATQEAWRASDEPTELFIRLAREEGLDADRFRSCMEERWTEERLLRSLKVGAEVDLDRTPTFFVQGRRLEGARSADTFREIFDRLAEARDAGEEGEAP